jgi:hypothetical protein
MRVYINGIETGQGITILADTLNFTRASELLYISQPTLSKQISALENELNAKLLIRDTHSVLLTDSGTVFLSEARKNHIGCRPRNRDRTGRQYEKQL